MADLSLFDLSLVFWFCRRVLVDVPQHLLYFSGVRASRFLDEDAVFEELEGRHRLDAL